MKGRSEPGKQKREQRQEGAGASGTVPHRAPQPEGFFSMPTLCLKMIQEVSTELLWRNL